MKREHIKTARGTARRLRRQDMSIFRAERDKRRDAVGAVDIQYKVFQGPIRAREGNPHNHAVATVTDVGNGGYVVRQYGWTNAYPANVPCPCREEVAMPREFRTYGAAKGCADEINRIF